MLHNMNKPPSYKVYDALMINKTHESGYYNCYSYPDNTTLSLKEYSLSVNLSKSIENFFSDFIDFIFSKFFVYLIFLKELKYLMVYKKKRIFLIFQLSVVVTTKIQFKYIFIEDDARI